jgi:hypothetical protein
MYTKRKTACTSKPQTDHWPIMGRAFARTDNRFALPITAPQQLSRIRSKNEAAFTRRASRSNQLIILILTLSRSASLGDRPAKHLL